MNSDGDSISNEGMRNYPPSAPAREQYGALDRCVQRHLPGTLKLGCCFANGTFDHVNVPVKRHYQDSVHSLLLLPVAFVVYQAIRKRGSGR